MPPRASAPISGGEMKMPPNTTTRAQHVKRHARALRTVDLGDQILAVLAQAGAFGRDVERVEELLHRRPRRRSSTAASARLRKPSADFVMAFGRQSSSSEQARQRSARQTGGGVRPSANSAPKARAVSSVSRRNSASNGTTTRRLRLAVEQRALGHRASGHLLQAQRLGAELHLVGAMQLGLAALEFDGKGGLAAVAGDGTRRDRRRRRGSSRRQASGSAVTRRTPRSLRAPAHASRRGARGPRR